jgi:hypothetical protein
MSNTRAILMEALKKENWATSLTEARIQKATRDAIVRDVNVCPAFCVACGAESVSEPDATGDRCDFCGLDRVFGAPVLLRQL